MDVDVYDKRSVCARDFDGRKKRREERRRERHTQTSKQQNL